MKIIRTHEMVHPLLSTSVEKIDREVIARYNAPFRLFETGRVHARHQELLQKGKTKDLVSCHLFDLENDPPLYTTAVDYVYYDGRWSWNLRDSTVQSWYNLFGQMVLDACPELYWGGLDRKSKNFCHFSMRRAILIDNLDTIPCVTP